MDSRVNVQGIDLGMGFVYHAMTELVTGPCGLRSVDLPHRAVAPAEVYESFFHAPVCFGRPVGLLRLAAGLFTRPIDGWRPVE